MWTRSVLFWSKTLFITIKCHILLCLASLIGTVTQKQYMMKVLIMFHGVTVKLYVKLCKCWPILKAVPHIQFVVTAKNRSILSQHRGGITPVKYNNGKPKGVLSLLTEEASFYWQHCTWTFIVNVPSSSYWCSPQYEPLTLSPSAASLLLSLFLSFIIIPPPPPRGSTDTRTSHHSAGCYIHQNHWLSIENCPNSAQPNFLHVAIMGWTDTSNYW